jgi:hypothetical protein
MRLPRQGDVRVRATADDHGVWLSRSQGVNMRPYTFIFRACVLASLVLTSAFMAGWKWDLAH